MREMNMYIKLWVDKDYSVIQIKDEGIGMTEEQIEKPQNHFIPISLKERIGSLFNKTVC